MASLFIADVMGSPMSLSQQLGLLAFMIVASKGAAGVSGAGLATLAGGLQAHRPDLLDGVGLIVGIDRFMAEARSVTNFSGNAVATLLIGCWTKTVDKARVDEVPGQCVGDEPLQPTTIQCGYRPARSTAAADASAAPRWGATGLAAAGPASSADSAAPRCATRGGVRTSSSSA